MAALALSSSLPYVLSHLKGNWRWRHLPVILFDSQACAQEVRSGDWVEESRSHGCQAMLPASGLPCTLALWVKSWV